jgi:hypothetical protein
MPKTEHPMTAMGYRMFAIFIPLYRLSSSAMLGFTG